VQSIAIFVSVCLLAYLKKDTFKLHAIFSTLHVALAQSSCHDNIIRYVLPVLWMTSRFHTLAQIQIQAITELFTVTR